MSKPPLYPPACQSTFLKGRHIRAKPPYVDVKRVLAILNSLYRNKAFALVRENLQNSIDAGARKAIQGVGWIIVGFGMYIALFGSRKDRHSHRHQTGDACRKVAAGSQRMRIGRREHERTDGVLTLR